MIITNIEQSRKNKNIYYVYVDHEYNFSIRQDDLYRLNIHVDKEITKDKINYIKNEVNRSYAKSKALKYVLNHKRTEKEVVNKLENEGIECDIIDEVIKELKQKEYINDKLYVEKYIKKRLTFNPKSINLIKKELLKKGISMEVVEFIFGEFEIDEHKTIEKLISKKFKQLDFEDSKKMNKVYTYLLYRGFNITTINEVINKLKNWLLFKIQQILWGGLCRCID